VLMGMKLPCHVYSMQLCQKYKVTGIQVHTGKSHCTSKDVSKGRKVLSVKVMRICTTSSNKTGLAYLQRILKLKFAISLKTL